MIIELFDSAAKRFKRGRQKTKDGQPRTPLDNRGNASLFEDQTEPQTVERVSRPPNALTRTNHSGLGVNQANFEKTAVQSPGFFPNAHGFIIKDSVMNKADVINMITTDIENGKPVLDRLSPHTALEAGLDSAARHPAPRCHPGTRRRISTKLDTWLADEQRQWKMVWLHGPAGVGKSAVAQTFAERCDGQGRLGAAFFFSRPNKRNKPHSVVPTLAYQLAVQCNEYKVLLTQQLVNNPMILGAAMSVQFRKLIADPFSKIQAGGSARARYPYLVVLDGLDECQEEGAQCEIVDMIGEVVRLKKDLPLLWLICSRPEPHLRYMFSKADFGIVCGRETLIIDDEAREEVDQYLRDSFGDIRAQFPYTTSGTWPSEEQFAEVSHAASGLFIVASTVLRFVGDPKRSNPPAQLDAFISFMKKSQDVGANHPLATLDL